MREIHTDHIVETVARLCIEAAHDLPHDVESALRSARDVEPSPLGVQVLNQILENADVARTHQIPLCRDTGVTVVIVKVGQDAHITGGYLYDAITECLRRGDRESYPRASIVGRPFSHRCNMQHITPPTIHTEIVPGGALHLTVMPKGFGRENMFRFAMLLPGAGREGIAEFVLQTVDDAGGNPCPPIIVGLGIGGSADQCM